MTIQEIYALLTSEERQLPISLHTGWEGAEQMALGFVAVLEVDDNGQPSVLLAQYQDRARLHGCKVARVVYDRDQA